MGVLEARYKAEKVGYPVVGEKTKDASDVVDYNIRDEQTKDLSYEINANNQTTTGMATVIPGVNAPKLIETTSIISYSKYCAANLAATTALLPPGEQITINNLTISDEEGVYKFEYIYGKGIQVPTSGTYQLDITYPEHGSFHYWNTRIYVRTRAGRETIVIHNGTTGSITDVETETLRYNFSAGDRIFVILEYVYVGSGTGADRSATISIDIRRLG